MGEFNSMLRQWYEAEVAGAAFFGAMARGAKVEAVREQWKRDPTQPWFGAAEVDPEAFRERIREKVFGQ